MTNPETKTPAAAAAPRPGSRIEQALRLLAEEARERVQRHPSGHLVAAGGDVLEVSLSLPATARGLRLDALAADTATALDRAVSALVAHRAAFRPGAVFCLRCGSAECDHAQPTEPRQVFAGYGNTGLPRFLDYAQWLLERSDPRVDHLYDEPPALLAHTALGRDLTGELLPAYRDSEAGYRLHGQVAAGWWRVPGADGHRESLALTFQIVSTRPRGAARRYGVNVLGRGPGGEPLEHLLDRLGELPWTAPARWAQEAVESVERTAGAATGGKTGGKTGGGEKGGGAKGGGKPRGKQHGQQKGAETGGRTAKAERHVDRRLAGVLNGLSRRLEKSRRSRDRKTLHARERHAQGDRPTHMALADLARAGDGDVLVDRRQDTLVVLGDKGRAHVFNPAGKLVTSIRYNPESIERRRKRDQWRPASAEEVAGLRGRVGTGTGTGDGGRDG